MNAKARFAGKTRALHSRRWLAMETTAAIIGNAVHILVITASVKQKMVLYAIAMMNAFQAVVMNFVLKILIYALDLILGPNAKLMPIAKIMYAKITIA